MFTGLFMIPWVLIYGLSALVFNHRAWFFPTRTPPAMTQLRETRDIPEAFWAASPLAAVESSESLARSFLAANKDAGPVGESGRWRLAPDAAPRFTRTLVLAGRDNGQNVELQLDLNQHAGTIQWLAPAVEQSRPAPVSAAETRRFKPRGAFVLDQAWLQSLGAVLGPLNPATNTAPESLRVRNAPELVFAAEADGRNWNVRCNLTTGEVVAREAGKGGSVVSDTAGFITRLHRTRGYPADADGSIRWWWAVIVDATAFLMLLWGASGLLMWWQMKGQRKWGAVTLGACGVVTWLIWTGMRDIFR
jgi:hypothetical protein